MKNLTIHIWLYGLLGLFLCCSNYTHAYNLRQYSVKEGLVDQVVLSSYQDRSGLMWYGTNNGISVFDGLHMQSLQLENGEFPFINCAVGTIFEAEDNIFWILTDKGLFCYDLVSQQVKGFSEFDNNAKISMDSRRNIYVLKEDNSLYYYYPSMDSFQKLTLRDLAFDNVIAMFVDKSDVIWIFTDDNTHRCFSMNIDEGTLKLTPQNVFKHQNPLLWCYYGDDEIYFVDATLTFYEYDLREKTKYYIRDIRSEVSKNGDITAIIRYQDDYFIGFVNEKLVRIKNTPDQPVKYQLDEINIPAGVTCLTKDCLQDIVWIGTAGQGVSMYFNEAFSLDAMLSRELNYPVENPITSVYLDKYNTLWLGTEGNGIINLRNYDPDTGKGNSSELFVPNNSLLNGSAVYAFAPSTKNLMWIGTEKGINYYSYSERRIKTVQLLADNKPVKAVRSICELNDTTLWIATEGEGIVKVRLAGSSDVPVFTSTKRIVIGDGEFDRNKFTTTFKEDDDIIWFGTDGLGVYKVNSNTERMGNTLFDKNDNPALNTVFSIFKNTYGYWFATKGGLVNLNYNEKNVYNEWNGLPFQEVYGMLEGNNGNLWLTTDRGIVKYNTQKESGALCKQSDNKAVSTFGEGVCFKDPHSGLLIFGGVNGYIAIDEHKFVEREYLPEISFTALSLFGNTCNIYDYFTIKKDKKRIKLNYDQNVFGITYIAKDYIDGQSYTYFYKLDELGERWINIGNSNVAFFTYLRSGKYTLSTKYRNNVTGTESPVYALTVYITPPWYLSWWAYLCYLLILALVIYVAWLLLMWYIKEKAPVVEIKSEKPVQQESIPHLNYKVDLGIINFADKEEREFYQKMLEAIEKNMTNADLSVEMLSEEIGCSTHQLYRRLKKITDKTPNEIIRIYRFSVVEQLLVSTELPVDEILLKAGFLSRSNFFKLFSQTHGITPKQYREERKKNSGKPGSQT